MKKKVWLFLCTASLAAFAQQAPEVRVQRSRSPEGHGRENGEKMTAPAGNEDVGTPSVSSQDNFDQIMGNFSDLAMKFSSEDDRDTDIFVYACQHVGGKAFSRSLEPFLSVNGEISDCEDSDLVIISDDREKIEELKKIAAAIDRPVRQILVSASVVEFQITDDFEKDISLQYNKFQNMSGLASSGTGDLGERVLDAIMPSSSSPSSLSGTSSYIYYNPGEQALVSSFLTFLETTGTAQILSSPSLIMRRGHTGNILSGEDIPITKSTQNSAGTNYSVDYKSVGIKLRVTPESIFEDRVVLEVSPEVSNIIRYEDSAAGRNPVVAIRSASTRLEMQNGYMVSIGGLLREESIESESQVPILGSIPLVGALFRKSSSESIRSQLVIFLSVNIMDPSELSMETIDSTEGLDELKAQVQRYHEAFPPEKSSFWGGVKRLFQ
jgi:type II secretory pathway component GspD/PulD (secretin)